jgi:hypothetical protein
MQFFIWVDNIGPHTEARSTTKTLRLYLTAKVNKLTMKDFHKETKHTISTYQPSTINNL